MIIRVSNTRKDPMYKHRFLTSSEKVDFVNLFKYNVSRNAVASIFFSFPVIICIFPIMWLTVVDAIYKTYTSFLSFIIPFFLGFIFLKLKFDISHMFAHALMLEYGLWNVDVMPTVFGDISLVIFYAFDHHHEDGSYWLRKLLSQSERMYYTSILFAHWESFSLFTQLYPFGLIGFVITKLLLLLGIYNPVVLSFVLGHEMGVILLPISHDWVHARFISKVLYYPFKFLEVIGIFATREKHQIHHQYNHQYVYKSFSSSGIFLERFDKYLDNLWDRIHIESQGLQYEVQKTLFGYTLMIYIVAWIFQVWLGIFF